MLIAAVAETEEPDRAIRGRVARLRDDGSLDGPVEAVDDLAAVVRAIDGAGVRWLWASTGDLYPGLLRAGVRVGRCHDLELVEALVLGAEGLWGSPRALGAVWARMRGLPVPADPPPRPAFGPFAVTAAADEGLFEIAATPPAAGFDHLTALIAGYAHQSARIDALAEPGRFRLLAAAESAGALLAAEMGHDGLPFSVAAHDDLLRELLGDPSPATGPPRRLAALAEEISAAFGSRVRPDSPADVLRAFHHAGYPIRSTRAWELRDVDHPAVPLLKRYKELYRIWTTHGWTWRAAWVRDGRFHAEYVPAGVVSGRWASRGGAALQIPRVIRGAVVADPGWKLVVADAGQLEPRILAAVSGDERMARAAGGGDMYAALAADAFRGDRAVAKVALLGAMYGQTGGAAVPALATLRRSYPVALAYVEDAARSGETGGLVRSWLGRTCPPPSASQAAWGDGERPDQWDDASGGSAVASGLAEVESDALAGRSTGARARARGRFTRNFVIQATAAEWALALLATLRTTLSGGGARIVFFQHDEVVVHAPAGEALAIAAAIDDAAGVATRLLFGATPVRFPLHTAIVDSYADASTHL